MNFSIGSALACSLGMMLLSFPAVSQLQALVVSAGPHHTCAIDDASQVRCWGWNYRGELGDGTQTERFAPVPAQLPPGVRHIEVEHSISCAVTMEGRVMCWGRSLMVGPNDFLNPFPLSTVPTEVPNLEGIVQVAIANEHACALSGTGSVTCWGKNNLQQLGDGTMVSAPVPSGRSVNGLEGGVVSIAAVGNGTCALLSTGGVRCWGYFGGPTVAFTVPGLESGVKSLSRGSAFHFCAVLAQGGVKCWGSMNMFGELGSGDTRASATPVSVVGLEGPATLVAVAENHSCAALAAGGVQCWGSNWGGQLGDGTREARLVPVRVSGISARVSSLATGVGHTCAVIEREGLRCWGDNGDGQLGDGVGIDRLTPTAVRDQPVIPSFQGLWWNAPAGSESGWGLYLAHQGDILFAAWFTYDADGSPMWLVMSKGERQRERYLYTGPLYRVTGDPFSAATWDSSHTFPSLVGTATLSFRNLNEGAFFYSVNNISTSKSITRNVFAARTPRCEVGAARAQPWNFEDLWWRSPAGSESGWGLGIAHQGDTIFATWFTYDAAGRPSWVMMSNGVMTGPNTYSGLLYRTSGPPYHAAWSSRPITTVPAGTATLTFSDAERGTFAYTLDNVSQVKPITRQVYSEPGTGCN